MQQVLSFRQHLFQMGQIVRKEFMLSDRVNWPQIPFPQRGQSMYAPAMPPRHVPQAMAYPPHPGPAVGPTPKRRGGHGPAGQPQMMGAGYQNVEGAFDDEEDISRGDMFDHLSPREISMARYQQNHEWMEEILSSPYRIGQIEAADLGLGRKGELASLTEGIFEAQGSDALTTGPKKPYTGQLDPGLAEEFRKRVRERNEAVKAEIEQMKAHHSKMLAKFKGNAVIRDAEQALCAASQDTVAEFWRLEGKFEDGEETVNGKAHKSLEEILASVEEVVGKRAVFVHDVHRIQDGGYQEPAPDPEIVQPPPQLPGDPAGTGLPASMSRGPSHAGSHASGVMIGDSDIDMGGTAAGLLDQMHTGFSSTSTPINNFPTPQPHLSAIPSSVATPANLNVPSPHPAHAPTSQPSALAQGDVRMDNNAMSKDTTTTAPDQGTGSGDWVVVPKDDLPPHPNQNPSSAMQSAGAAIAPAQQQQQQQPALSKPVSAAATPLNFDADNNDFSSLGDLDTAGDALASYDPPSRDDDDLNMDMVEDSAFGDAFHGVEHAQEGSTPADGGL
jgi:hypothetical protein